MDTPTPTLPTYAYLREPRFWLEAAVVLVAALFMSVLMSLIRLLGFAFSFVLAIYDDLVAHPAQIIRGVAHYYSMEREPASE